MLFASIFVSACLLGVSRAQTPQGFTPSVQTQLDIMFNNTLVNQPGQLLTKAQTASQPQIALASVPNQSDKFMFMMLDLDVMAKDGSNKRQMLLHAAITNFKATAQKVSVNGKGQAMLLASQDKTPASYLGPSPPATDIAHRYVQLLFTQPATLKAQASDFSNQNARLNFDLQKFIKDNGLSNPIAANFFTVDGKASAAASGSRTASGGIAKNTLQPFTGAASTKDLPLGLAGLMGGLALLGL